MERHFMSRPGSVAHLVAAYEQAGQRHSHATTDDERRKIREQLDSLKQLLLDVRAARVDSFTTGRIEVVIKV